MRETGSPSSTHSPSTLEEQRIIITVIMMTAEQLPSLWPVVPSVNVPQLPVKTDLQASEMLQKPDPAMMARDVLTRSRWSQRLSTTTWSSVTTATTRGVTPPTSPTTSLNRRKSARRTSEKLVSLNTRRLPSMRLLKSAELHL